MHDHAGTDIASSARPYGTIDERIVGGLTVVGGGSRGTAAYRALNSEAL